MYTFEYRLQFLVEGNHAAIHSKSVRKLSQKLHVKDMQNQFVAVEQVVVHAPKQVPTDVSESFAHRSL